MKVIGYDPYLSKEVAEKKGVDVVSLDELLGRSDFISVHTPLTDETRNLIDKRAFPKMKKASSWSIVPGEGSSMRRTSMTPFKEEGGWCSLGCFLRRSLPLEIRCWNWRR